MYQRSYLRPGGRRRTTRGSSTIDSQAPSTSNGLNASALAWLATAEGEALLATAKTMPEDRLTRLSLLRKLVPAPLAAAALTLCELRRRARSKFAAADTMFFTPEGLEQATGDAIAAYRAGRFPEDAATLDACSGVGGDAVHLAGRGRVVAVDRNPAAAFCTRQNVQATRAAAGRMAEAYALCADVTALPLGRLADRGVRFAFFDPSRRADSRVGGRRRVRGSEDYSPPLTWVHALRSAFGGVAAKVSPSIDDAAITFDDMRVEFVSDRGECKEAILWFGSLAEALPLPMRGAEPYYATVLRPAEPPATLARFDCHPLELGPIADYLYEPDPAVIRAHLMPQFADRHDATWVEPGIAYLTASRYTPTPFASAYRVIETLNYQEKAVQSRLRALGGHLTAVKKRGVPFDPAAVQKSLSPCGDRPLILFLMRRAGKAIAMLCERIERVDARPKNAEE